MGDQSTDACMASCARVMTEERFNVRDRWGTEMNEIEIKNEKIWNDFLEKPWS